MWRGWPLPSYYFVRGLSLLFLLAVRDVPSLHVFAVVFGLNYFSTVPPTTTLTANTFGRYSVGELSGWIFFSHQVGSALAAVIGGWIHNVTGSYFWAFISVAVPAVIAAGLTLAGHQGRAGRDSVGPRRGNPGAQPFLNQTEAER